MPSFFDKVKISAALVGNICIYDNGYKLEYVVISK